MDAPRRFTMSTAPPDGETPPPPLQFVLEGDRLPDTEGNTEHWEETFTVLDTLPAGALADLTYSVTVEDGELVYHQLGVVRFLRSVIVPADEHRWDVLIRDKQRPVKLELLADVMFYITGAKTNRPTGPRPGSPNGSRGTSNGSAADSSTQGTPPTS